MEALPDLSLFYITADLSGSELATCCAVSRVWRDRLNHNDFWRHRCDKQMAEYLRQTECQVQPFFINPQQEENTRLSDIGEWRLAYMRQTHLWNNWRKSRYNSVLVPDETDSFTRRMYGSRNPICDVALLYKNDFLIVCVPNEIQMWCVQQTPVKMCVKTLPSSKPTKFFELSGDSLVIKQSNLLQIYEISTTKAEFVLTRSVVTSKASFRPVLFLRNILIEVKEKLFIMEVWNVETVEKVKQEKKENSKIILGVNTALSLGKNYFAIVARKSFVGKNKYFVLVYRLPDVAVVFTSKLYKKSIFEISLVKNHLLINFQTFIEIYCFKTGQHIKQVKIGIASNFETFGDKVYFVNNIDTSGDLLQLNPGSKEEDLVLAKLSFKWVISLQSLNSKYFLGMTQCSSNQSHCFWLGQVEGKQPGHVTDLRHLPGIDATASEVNEARTKIVLGLYADNDRGLSEEFQERIEVITFW